MSPIHRYMTVDERFWLRVTKTDGCWIWNGRLSKDGYGILRFEGEGKHASRVSWVLHFGPVPDGCVVCHTCDNRKCVRPQHLFLGTPAANIKDAARKGRMHKGMANGRAKLTEVQVIEIRQLHVDGMPKLRIAALFGVSDALIGKIVRKEIWSHVS